MCVCIIGKCSEWRGERAAYSIILRNYWVTVLYAKPLLYLAALPCPAPGWGPDPALPRAGLYLHRATKRGAMPEHPGSNRPRRSQPGRAGPLGAPKAWEGPGRPQPPSVEGGKQEEGKQAVKRRREGREGQVKIKWMLPSKQEQTLGSGHGERINEASVKKVLGKVTERHKCVEGDVPRCSCNIFF